MGMKLGIKLNNFYSSESVVTMIKSRRTGHEPRMGAKKNAHKALVEI
jgi:hypothetical protein